MWAAHPPNRYKAIRVSDSFQTLLNRPIDCFSSTLSSSAHEFSNHSTRLLVSMLRTIGDLLSGGSHTRPKYDPDRHTMLSVFRSRQKIEANAAVAPIQTARTASTTQRGATPTLRSTKGRKFQQVMCT